MHRALTAAAGGWHAFRSEPVPDLELIVAAFHDALGELLRAALTGRNLSHPIHAT